VARRRTPWRRGRATRRPDERPNLERWITRHPDAINNWYGTWCRTPLHQAARFGREDLAEVLVNGGADVNAADRANERPLHLAAAYGKPGVVSVLLERGADIEARGSGGKTPLHAAAFGLGGPWDVQGRVEVARLLIGAGARLDARTPDGKTARDLAANEPEIVAILSR
jgi:ankyrin repeat protein